MMEIIMNFIMAVSIVFVCILMICMITDTTIEELWKKIFKKKEKEYSIPCAKSAKTLSKINYDRIKKERDDLYHKQLDKMMKKVNREIYFVIKTGDTKEKICLLGFDTPCGKNDGYRMVEYYFKENAEQVVEAIKARLTAEFSSKGYKS